MKYQHVLSTIAFLSFAACGTKETKNSETPPAPALQPLPPQQIETQPIQQTQLPPNVSNEGNNLPQNAMIRVPVNGQGEEQEQMSQMATFGQMPGELSEGNVVRVFESGQMIGGRGELGRGETSQQAYWQGRDTRDFYRGDGNQQGRRVVFNHDRRPIHVDVDVNIRDRGDRHHGRHPRWNDRGHGHGNFWSRFMNEPPIFPSRIDSNFYYSPYAYYNCFTVPGYRYYVYRRPLCGIGPCDRWYAPQRI